MPLQSGRCWHGRTPRKRPRSPSKLDLALEHLEDRSTPAAVFWDGGGGNSNWFNALNWNNDLLPTLADDVTISAAANGVEINDTFGTASAGTLTSSSDLRVISGTLQLAGDSHVSGAFTLAGVTFGGVVTGSGTLTLSGDVTWGVNGVMAGTGTTVLTGTSTLAGNTFGSIRENRVLENAGDATLLAGQSFNFNGNTVFRNLAGGTLTIEGGAGFGTFFQGTNARFVNAGTVAVEGPGTTGVGVFTENSGTLTAAGATLNLTGLTNSGTVSVAGGALNTGSTLTNSGTVSVSGGNLTISGPGTSSGDIELAGGATMVVTNTAFTPPFTLQGGATVTGGPIVVGTFEKLAASGAVTADAVRLAGGNLEVLAGGNLAVGTLEQAGTVTSSGSITVANGWTFTSGTLTSNGNLTVNGPVTWTNGTLTGTGTATLNGNLNWTAGSMSGTGRTVLNGTTTVNGSVIADNRQFENAGTATVTTGGISFRNAAKWTNLPGSVFEVRAGDPATTFFSSGQFINQGTILKTTTGNANIGLPVINQSGGVIDVDGGTLRLVASSASSAGTFDVAGGANLTIGSGSGTFTLLAGAAGVGAGEVLIAGAPVVVSGAASLGNLRMQGGALTANAPLTVGNFTGNSITLNGPADVTVNGQFIWTGGGMSGTGKTILNGTGTITGGILDGRTIDNAGTVTIGVPPTASSLQFRGNAVWNNLPGSVLQLNGTSGISSFFASVTSAVNNAGTIRKTGAVGNVSQIAVPLINSGRVEILGGDLTTVTNSRHSGVVDIASNGRWMVTSGPHFLDAGATTTGAGLLFLQNNLTVTGTASVARLQHNGAALTVNAALTIGDYLFNAGTLTGTGKTTLTGNSSFAGTGTKVISAHTVDNAGTVTWSQTGTIQMANGAVFTNLAGALFDVTNDAQLVSSGGTPAFNNAGTLRKSAGGGPIFPAFGPSTRWGVPLNNSGLLDIRTGNFQPVPPFGLPATVPMLNNTGTIQVGTATSSASSLVLPVVPVSGLPTYTLAGGTLTGTGQIGLPGPTSPLIVSPGATLGGTLTVWGSVVNRGTVQPGTTSGTLTVVGNYTQVDDATADGRLVIGLRGDSGSGLFGKLQVNGQSNLAGALEVFADGGFLPDFGDVFQVFRSVGPRAGDFTYPAGGYDLDGYRVLTHEYDGTGLRLNLVTGAGALPVIDPIDDVTVNEGQTVNFTATVSGAEPPGPLTFSLAAGSSPGGTIDPQTGAFSFLAAAGPGEYVFQIAAHDPNAPTDPFDVETFKVTVLNVAPTVTLTGGQPELDEGQEFTAGGSFSDPGADEWTATVDYGDGTGTQALALNPDGTFALAHHYRDDGDYTVTVRVFDGHEYGVATFEVEVANLASEVIAAADQTAGEGTAQEFDLGSFADAGVDDGPWTVQVSWGDGSDPVVFQTTYQGLLDPLAHTFADNGTYSVTVTVTDKDGASASDTFTVMVANVAPVAEVTGPLTGVRGQVRTFTLSATDSSAVDQAAGFTFLINWGDGTTQEVTGASGTTVEHTYTDAGDYTVTVTAADKDGGVSEAATHAISVVVAEVQDGVLVVGGTTGSDAIQVKKGAVGGTSLEVIVNGVNLGEFGGLTRAVIYGQSGTTTWTRPAAPTCPWNCTAAQGTTGSRAGRKTTSSTAAPATTS